MNGCKFYTTLTKMKTKPLPDLNYLKECFIIDPSVPEGLRWRTQRPESHFEKAYHYKRWVTLYAGKACGSITSKGYCMYYSVHMSSNRLFNHRIIYALYNNTVDFNGKIIDHIDGNTQNNDPKNLRLVTASQNSFNSCKRKDNKTGHKNILFFKRDKRYWCVVTTMDGKKKFVGSYKTLEEALEARNFFYTTTDKNNYRRSF